MFGRKKEDAMPAEKNPKETRTPLPLSADATAASKPAEPPRTATFRYVDRPECVETFADAISALSFDGQTLRIEFAVSRLDESKPNAPMTGRRYPACRLVLPPGAAVDLMQKMQQVAQALIQSGYLKPAQPTDKKS
jgi:hypothetical protein